MALRVEQTPEPVAPRVPALVLTTMLFVKVAQTRQKATDAHSEVQGQELHPDNL